MRARAGLFLAVALSLSACGGSSTTASPTASSPSSAAPASEAPVQSGAPSASGKLPGASVAPSGKIYVIRKGDTLYVIARKFNVTLKALRAANPAITDPTKIRVGQKIVIPSK
jgi:2',3'-cyclic-nucleotide 2'-phosphodiesterase / 3'-nucleotidase